MSLAVRGRVLRALLALPLLAFPAAVHASGFAIESQGARAMGFAGAYVAQAADPSAIFYNAAGIGFLKGKQLYGAGAFAGLSTDFTGSGPNPPAGTLETSNDGLSILPAFYYSQAVGEKTVIGLGVSRPFGIRSKWDNPDTFSGRYICLDCQISSWSINPTVAYKLADRFAVGGGARRAPVEVQALAPPDRRPQPLPGPDRCRGADPRQQHGHRGRLQRGPAGEPDREPLDRRLLPSQGRDRPRRPGELRPDPHREPRKWTTPWPWPFPRRSPPRRASPTRPASPRASPSAAATGLVEADFQWMLWSSFDQVTITYANSPAFDTVLPQDWASTWRGALGFEYLIGNDWEVRGGFGYDHSPAPTETISPFIHDADRYTFGGGGSYKYERLRLDFNIRYVAFRTSSTLGISRYDYNGSYETRAGSRSARRSATGSSRSRVAA